MIKIFDPTVLAQVPPHFWTVCFFAFGCVVGSFLNVCIHRMPRDESIIHPPSHCPHCGYSIPWYLNIPLVTWLWLGGRCANCKKEISMRYFLVEALTGTVFALCWLVFGHQSPAAAVVQCVLMAGLIAATFIDFEHFIIPDEITIGGMVVGLLLAFFVPSSHMSFPGFRPWRAPGPAMRDSVEGMIVGAGIVYAILRLGKLLFGRYKIALPPGTRILFTETALKLPDGDMPYEELFYRPSDMIRIEAEKVELIDRCYAKVELRLQAKKLRIGQDSFDPEQVVYLEAIADHVVLPREAMGLGDVKFMAAIGAFLGWPAVVFSLALSSVIGSVVGVALIVMRRRQWSARMPYGPYIAVAAVIWVFGGYKWLRIFL
jgi:leader peptidase (prepilin peptidase)/N-methyltransferase